MDHREQGWEEGGWDGGPGGSWGAEACVVRASSWLQSEVGGGGGMTTCVAAFRTEATFSCSSSTFSSKVARTSMHRPRTWRHGTMQEDVRGDTQGRGGVHVHMHMCM